MQKEFIAWHREKNIAYRITGINFSKNIIVLLEEDKETFSCSLDEVCLLLNTGQKDVMGHEIYEGDILMSQVEGQIIQVKFGVYPSYCPVDKCEMQNVGFYAISKGYSIMPIGDTVSCAVKLGNEYGEMKENSTRNRRHTDTSERIYLTKNQRRSLGLMSGDPIALCIAHKQDGFFMMIQKVQSFETLKRELEFTMEKVCSGFLNKMNDVEQKDYLEALEKAQHILIGSN